MQQTSAAERATVREAVGVFQDTETLQSALDALESSGFRHEEISVLAPRSEVREKLLTENPQLSDIMDNPDTPRAVYIPKEVRGEIAGSLVGVPLYIGAILGGVVGIIQQAGWPYIVAGLVMGGVTGALVGGLAAFITTQWWSRQIRWQLKNGGLVLWVNIRDQDQEAKAWRVLSRKRAQYLHVHDIPAD